MDSAVARFSVIDILNNAQFSCDRRQHCLLLCVDVDTIFSIGVNFSNGILSQSSFYSTSIKCHYKKKKWEYLTGINVVQ